MCGIAGIVSRGRLSGADREFLQAALAVMAHRGPDDSGIWTSDCAGFAHRRLSIIDLESGAQPMSDASGRYTIVFNGEIYNYRELRALLAAKGRQFLTRSDTEVILNAYAEWGTDCAARFNGIFAFGIWDGSERSLFLARDPLGVKPLLYHEGGGCLVFASELKAILRHPAVPAEVDARALSDYLSLGYVLAPKTIIRGVRKLPPATWLLWKDGYSRCGRYWDLAALANSAPRRFKSEGEAVEELRGHLDRVVRTQLVSDVPVGAFLSGGIDSSTVVQKMVGSYPARVQTFSIGFREKSFSELPYARMAADYLGTEHYQQVISPDCEDLLPRMVGYFDEPFSDTSAVPTFLLCRWARERVKVSLSGDGGDECFAGYETYRADRMRSLYSRVPALLHRLLVNPAVALLPSTHRKVSWDYKLKQFVRHARLSPERAHYSWRLLFSEEEKKALLDPCVLREVGDYTPLEAFLEHYSEVEAAPELNRHLYVDARTWLADAMLVKVDRASMAHGLEVRVPLLDPGLVEFATSLPPELKLRGFRTKYILKKVMEGSLPRSIVHRSKRGFNAPVAHWVDHFSPAMTRETCALLRGLPEVWPGLMRDHRARRADNSFKLWTLLIWSLWRDSVLDRAGGGT